MPYTRNNSNNIMYTAAAIGLSRVGLSNVSRLRYLFDFSSRRVCVCVYCVSVCARARL